MTTVIAEATEQQNKNNNNWKTAARTHTHTKIKKHNKKVITKSLQFLILIVQKWNSRVKDQKSRNYF